MSVSLLDCRNIGIIAHIDAGKTTTSERILYYTGRTHKIGDVDKGNTVLDWMPQEQDRGITITSASTTCFWNQVQINLIDTPGHVDFTAEVERSLRVLDGAIGVFCSVGGVQPQSETVWNQANRYKTPRLAYINKMDRIGANFEHVLHEIRTKLFPDSYPICLPIGSESQFEGVIDVIEMKELHFEAPEGSQVVRGPIRDELAEQARRAREDLIDKLSQFSDSITELYLDGKEIPTDLIKKVLRQATLANKIVPVLCGSSLRNIGVQPLLDAIVAYLPSPSEVGPITAHHVHHGKEVSFTPSEKDLCALVFKVQNDPMSGILHYVRVYSGTLESGSGILNIGKKKKERIGRVVKMHANRIEQVDALQAGDIGAVIGLKYSQTGDTLAREGFQLLLEPMHFPEPVISVAIEPKTMADLDKLLKSLEVLSLEDPTFKVKENKETGQILISGMGELHLDVLTTRLLTDFKVEARIGSPQVSYRETITNTVIHREILDKVIGGKPQKADLTLRLSPNKGQGNVYKSSITTAKLPEPYQEAVQAGIEASWMGGVLLGYPMIDLLVELFEANFDPENTSPAAWEAAASMAFDAACRKANPVQMHPIMKVEIFCPRDNVGEVIGYLSMKGGVVQSIESQMLQEIIHAHAPLKEMFGFSTQLRSLTQGRGSFSMEFHHFEEI